MIDAEKLLDEVSEKMKKFEASQKESGELFNIFSITKIERREVDTHSAMIAELLNPQGRHGQHDKFLIEFLKIVTPTLQFTETEQAKVFKEKSFDKSRIDILIELDDHVFVIENKIDAEDGHKQLQRYKEILDTHFKGKTGNLIYLTKYGSEAEKFSLGTVKNDEYHRISYKNHIVNWLNSCIETLNTQPKVEYALKQYQDLIKKITGQNMTHNLKNELVELLLKDNNFESAQKIASVISLAKGKILFQFFQKLEEEITRLPNVSVKKNYHPNLEYNENENEEKCLKWFLGGKENRHIGVFFDIGIPNVLFRIEVATHKLHYGIVPMNQSNLENIPSHFTKRDWRITWYSKIYKDVFHNINLIKDENSQHLVDEVKNAIYMLRTEGE
jgi:hypothetical protein